jgi:hypothetical protein
MHVQRDADKPIRDAKKVGGQAVSIERRFFDGCQVMDSKTL